MEEKSCHRCGTKHLINNINYKFENCEHIYCVSCVFQNIFLNSLHNLNNFEKSSETSKEKFKVECKCKNGFLEIPMDSVEDLFSKKYTVDTEEMKEKNYCKKHKNVEKTLFCKECEEYVCPKCTNINNNENTENTTPGNDTQTPEMSDHLNHKVVKIEELCNKYKEFLKDIQIESRTINQFVEKFNMEITKYENELEKEINSTVKQIDDIIDKLYRIKEEYTKFIDKKYSNYNLLLKIIKLFYANYYLDYENKSNINDVFTLKYLKDVNYEFGNIEFIKEEKENSLESILTNIKGDIEKINIKNLKSNNFSFKFNQISRKFNIIQKLLGHRQMINSIIELHDGRLLTGGADYKMKFWEDQGGRFVETLTIGELTGDILCLFELTDKRIISTIKSSGAMKIWRPKKDNESLYELTFTLSEHKSSVTSLVQLSDERLITGSKDKTIIIWSISDNSFKCKQIITEHTQAIYCLCLLTGVNFASGSEDKTIRIWEEKDGIFKNVSVLKDHKTRVRALALTLNGLLITGGDKIIIVYKLKKGKYVKFSVYNAHSSNITKIIKLSDGKIASCGRDCLIKIWTEKNGELTMGEELKGHTHSVYDIVELKDGRLASVSGDNLVIIWKSGKIID